MRPKATRPLTERDRKSQANELKTSVYALKAAPPATAYAPQIDAWQPPEAAYDSMYTQVELVS